LYVNFISLFIYIILLLSYLICDSYYS